MHAIALLASAVLSAGQLAPGSAGARRKAGTVEGHEIDQVIVRRAAGRDADEEENARVSRERMKVHLARDRARLERADGTVLVVRLGEGVVFELDTLTHSYKRKTFRQLREAWALLNAMLLEQIAITPLGHPRRAELIDQLTDGPEKWNEVWKLPEGDSRAALVRKYGLPEEPPEVEVRAADKAKEVAGVRCRRFEAIEDGEVRDWAYVAAKLPFDGRYYNFMELAGWIARDLAEGLRKAKGLARGRGLPLETVMHVRTGGRIELRTESIAPRELDGELFEVPDGYTERKERSGFR